MNMKKMYVTPTTEVTELELSSMLAISGGGTLTVSNQEADEELSNDRRGGWGNLWE